MALAVPNAGKHACNNAALHCHAALPYKGNFQQVVLVVIPVEKKHIPQARADKPGKAAVNADIKNALVPASVLLG